MANPTPERIEAAVRAAYPNTDFEIFDELQPLRDEYRARIARALAAAAGVAPRRDDLVERIADTLAYYQCRETNPKADDPRMGYHAFSEEQRAHLRERKAEAAAEIVRMFAAAGAAPQEPPMTIEDLNRAFGSRTGGPPSFTAEGEGDEFLFGRPPVPMQVDEAKLAEVLHGALAGFARVYVSGEELAKFAVERRGEWLRGGQQ
ncbi:hypothetical protein ACF07D_04745 [Leucobacter sp. NPDC015123]|uniref:hypothetical protein n=1 Tax=Leucobacter sp. NPDC015123 TaxID=3364129 RepID=UPI0036F4AB17